MKLTNRQSTLFTLIGLALTAVCAIFALVLFQLPALSETRAAFDRDRITLLTGQRQQSNLATIQSQLADVDSARAALDGELWSFAAEEEFFDRWDSFGTSHGVQVDLDQVAEVVPGNQPLTRGLELTLRGEPPALYRAIEDLQKTRPLLAIQRVTVTPGLVSGELTAQLIIETVWQ